MCGVNDGGEAAGVGDIGGAGVRVVRTTTSVRVEATIPVSAAALFGVMRDPLRHSEIDGSGTVQVPAGQPPITAVGQRFSAQVHLPGRSAYPVVNHVVAFEPDRLLAWLPANPDTPPLGIRWEWSFTGTTGGAAVSQTCDWSAVTDTAYLRRVRLPRVSPAQMSASLARLGRAARSRTAPGADGVGVRCVACHAHPTSLIAKLRK
ncbi:Polyketide cyclase/dehydrase [Rhodococcus rhodochrous ATCC 21198]|nr:Polyketide cyclase/dehydrase [Rhodococcus rhodochrous ATCC 21198]KDE13150.1 hypothetical protein N505_0111695 [Rhodococcus aetherivorans]